MQPVKKEVILGLYEKKYLLDSKIEENITKIKEKKSFLGLCEKKTLPDTEISQKKYLGNKFFYIDPIFA